MVMAVYKQKQQKRSNQRRTACICFKKYTKILLLREISRKHLLALQVFGQVTNFLGIFKTSYLGVHRQKSTLCSQNASETM